MRTCWFAVEQKVEEFEADGVTLDVKSIGNEEWLSIRHRLGGLVEQLLKEGAHTVFLDLGYR